jgi:hypothetical protein
VRKPRLLHQNLRKPFAFKRSQVGFVRHRSCQKYWRTVSTGVCSKWLRNRANVARFVVVAIYTLLSMYSIPCTYVEVNLEAN